MRITKDRQPDIACVPRDCAFLLLAGGRSRRMGRDKALETIGRLSMLELQLEKARALGLAPLLVSGDREVPADARCVPDILPDRGPLGGLLSGFAAAERRSCLVLCVDAPLVPVRALDMLLNAHAAGGAQATIVRHGGRTEPLIGVYDTDTADVIAPMLRNGGAPAHALLERLTVRYMDIDDEQSFMNCNTPDDLDRARRCATGNKL